jgi:hypothetical protein
MLSITLKISLNRNLSDFYNPLRLKNCYFMKNQVQSQYIFLCPCYISDNLWFKKNYNFIYLKNINIYIKITLWLVIELIMSSNLSISF